MKDILTDCQTYNIIVNGFCIDNTTNLTNPSFFFSSDLAPKSNSQYNCFKFALEEQILHIDLNIK